MHCILCLYKYTITTKAERFYIAHMNFFKHAFFVVFSIGACA